MRSIMNRGLSLLCALILMLSMVSVGAMSASAEAVVPRAVQRQWETQWQSVYYGGRSLYDTGCGIFAIVNAVGYVTGNEMSVTEVAQWAYDIKAFNYSTGGTIRAMLYPYLEDKYGEEYGFTVDHNNGEGYWQSASSTLLKNHLLGGGVAIGHVYGHFIAVVGYDSSTNMFHVYDSAPSSSRGTINGNGDAWVTESWFTTSTKLTLDWFVLVTGTGDPINLDYGEDRTGTSADKLGTYQLNSSAPSSDPLNVRTGAGTSYDIVTTVQEGDIVNVSELSGTWGKLTTESGTEGWASITNYADYIGVDALASAKALAWGDITSSVDEEGRLTLTNNSTDQSAVDFQLPLSIGTKTTPYFVTQIVPNSGNGYYFGLTQNGSAYFMMRDCNSGDELVNESTAPYMTETETLSICIKDWWKPADGYRIDTVRMYIAPSSSITINYMYFAASSGVVTDTTYNLERGSGATALNETLMTPDTLAIVDRTKAGSYTYNDGKLTVVSEEDSGYEVMFTVNKAFKPEELHRWLYSVDASVRYDIELVLTTSEGDRAVSLVSDFWPDVCTAPDGNYIPAATQSAGLDLRNVFVYNSLMPADGVSTIKTVTVKAGGKGTVTVNSIQIANNDVLVAYNDGISKSDSSPDAISGLRGDVNNDGVVNTADARLVLMYTVSIATFTETEAAAADYNGDGTITTADAREILMSLS